MDAYEPLQRYLQAQGEEHVILSFSEIADIIGTPLPKSAREDVAWWANDPVRPEAKAWMDAGYHAAFVSLASESVTFIKVFARVP